MRDDDRVAGLIARVVAGAGMPGRGAREDLRRELEAHFEDAGAGPDAVEAALRRFGSEAEVAGALRRVYRRDAALLSAARIAASVVASAAAAMLIEAAANLRLASPGAGWRIGPGFAYAAPVAVTVALAIVAGREAVRAMRRSPAFTHGSMSWLAAFTGFAAGEYGLHLARGVAFGPARALAAAAVLVAVWASTLLIVQRVDRVFVRVLETA